MSSLKLKSDKRVLISPFTPLSIALRKFVESNFNVRFLGFIDSSKSGDKIFNPKEIESLDFDLILILSPNHALNIFNALTQHSKKSKLQIIDLQHGSYFIQNIWQLKLAKLQESISVNIMKHSIKYLKKFFVKKDHILFIAPDFVDNNIKDLYIYISTQTDYRAVIATNNLSHEELLINSGFHVIKYPSLAFVYNSLKSNITILDHTPNSKLLKESIKNSYTVQIWHGIALKKIGGADYKDIDYDLFISTSDYVSENNFKDVFKYKEIINSGYPRNDIFSDQDITQMHKVFLSDEIYEFVKDSSLRTIVYMPTYRENSFASNPLDFEMLNQFAKENNLFIIIKLHPFSTLGMFDTLSSERFTFRENYSENILFYPNGKDIYPILKFSSMLITDYSSIYFDYLLIDKPILFFVYDMDEYIGSRGDFMLDFERVTPGKKCYDFDDLREGIQGQLQNDTFAQEREKLKDKLFEKSSKSASEEIFKKLKDFS